MIVIHVELVDLIEMRKTDCSGKTRLIRTYLAHHQLESVINMVIIISIIIMTIITVTG